MTILKRVLLVEDNLNDVELTIGALQKYNLANGVDEVHDGAEALDYLYYRGAFSERPKIKPAVILLDLKLPKVSGLEVLQQIKADPELRMIPVVVLTSSREDCDIIEAYDFGTNAYVVKPVDFVDFTKAIRDLGSFWAIINEVPNDR